MLPDARIRLNRAHDWGEKRPIYVSVSDDVALTVQSSPSPQYRVRRGSEVIVSPAAPDGYSTPDKSVSVWVSPDLEGVGWSGLDDGAYTVDFRFEVLAAGETIPRRYVRSVDVVIG